MSDVTSTLEQGAKIYVYEWLLGGFEIGASRQAPLLHVTPRHSCALGRRRMIPYKSSSSGPDQYEAVILAYSYVIPDETKRGRADHPEP